MLRTAAAPGEGRWGAHTVQLGPELLLGNAEIHSSCGGFLHITLSVRSLFFTKLGAFGSGFQPGYLLMHAARETSFLPASSSPAPPAGQAVLTQGGQRRADLAP